MILRPVITLHWIEQPYQQVQNYRPPMHYINSYAQFEKANIASVIFRLVRLQYHTTLDRKGTTGAKLSAAYAPD